MPVGYDEAEAQEVLSLSYQIRGLSAEEADLFVEHLARDKSQLVPCPCTRASEYD